ncbi:MAG: Spx/MgsR family RNA polymerase-binding regulatory protein [Bacteroidia bacterium]|nr:Spx/MgsR family RNA polymerase-binding regulatory protein [Bacteroidia bacterium]
MKKAFTWLDNHGIAYTFHDYKKLGIDESTIKQWLQEFDIDQLINTKGTTFKKLDEVSQKEALSNPTGIKLMMAYTSMIKRPIVVAGKRLLLGFDAANWEKELG